ncbi:MAG: hypothetical protein JO362_05815 [Streptomycetaceae bacterium]|nr:hypothetical protein [Streptomycetaceae bacterium]
MKHRKNRAQVARIAAGAVFVLGASLTAVGTAQAASTSGDSSSSQTGPCLLIACGAGDNSGGNGNGSGGGTGSGGSTGSGGGTGVGADLKVGANVGNGTGGSDQGSGLPGLLGGPSQNPAPNPSPTLPQSPPQAPPQSGGNAGIPVGGSKVGGNGGGSTCTLGQDSVNCGGNNNLSTDNNTAPQEISQGQAKQQLAETGSSGAEFLLIGAATMIAGGVAFRLMPRLANRRTAA